MSDEQQTQAPTCYRHPDRATYVSCQRCGRPICPECQTTAAVGVQCPECVRAGRPESARGAQGVLRSLRPGRSGMVSYVLIGLCVIAYILQMTVPGFTSAFLLNPTRVGAEPYRLLTSAFLHSPVSIIHLLFNMYALYALGPTLEGFLGRARFIALYLIGALGGSLGALVVYQLAVATNGWIIEATNGFLQPALSLGASGAVFALMGAYLTLRKAIGVDFTQLLIVLGINLVIGFVVPSIAWEAHLGGLAAGAAVGFAYARTRRIEQRPTQIALVAGIAGILVAILVAFVASYPFAYGL